MINYLRGSIKFRGQMNVLWLMREITPSPPSVPPPHLPSSQTNNFRVYFCQKIKRPNASHSNQPAQQSAVTVIVKLLTVHFAAKNRNSELRQLILSEKSEIVSQESTTVLR